MYWIEGSKLNEFFIFDIVSLHKTCIITHELLFCFYQIISYQSLLASLYVPAGLGWTTRMPFIIYFISQNTLYCIFYLRWITKDILEIRKQKWSTILFSIMFTVSVHGAAGSLVTHTCCHLPASLSHWLKVSVTPPSLRPIFNFSKFWDKCLFQFMSQSLIFSWEQLCHKFERIKTSLSCGFLPMLMGSNWSLFSPHFIPMFCFSLAALQISSSGIRHEYGSFNTYSLTNSHNYARAYSSSKLCKYIYLYFVCMSIYLSTYLSTYLVYLSLYIHLP